MKQQTDSAAALIGSGGAILGIELGSTRIKASLIAPDTTPLASGSHAWENQLRDGVWTYDMADVWAGLAACYAALVADVRARYAVNLEAVAAMGFSAMMHGYVALDAEGRLLVPFRTWRNNITGQACAELTPLLDFAVPQRWSIAHLYQSILDEQPHVARIAHLTTLAGYVHWMVSGAHSMGVGEASGMFPIDPATGDWDAARMATFDALIAPRGLGWTLRDILPSVLPAGRPAGRLTPAGARLIDPSGGLRAGVPLCPPEGDAGTGMVATNAVRPRSGNVSAGTSMFAMIVLDKALARVHDGIDIVVTPDGAPVAMAHANNGSSDLDAWIALFGQVAEAMGGEDGPRPALRQAPAAGRAGRTGRGRAPGHQLRLGRARDRIHRGPPAGRAQPGQPAQPGESHPGDGLRVAVRSAHGDGHPDRAGGGGHRRDPRPRRLLQGRRHRAADDGRRARRPGQRPGNGRRGRGVGDGRARFLPAPGRHRGSLPDYLDERIAASIGEPVLPDPRDVEGFEAFYARHRDGLAIEREAVKALS